MHFYIINHNSARTFMNALMRERIRFKRSIWSEKDSGLGFWGDLNVVKEKHRKKDFKG